VRQGQLVHHALQALGVEHGARVRGAGHQDHELLAAEAGGQVARAAAGLAQQLGDAHQALVALQVAGGVVVGLEVVHVAQDQGQRLALPPGDAQLLVQPDVQAAAVGQARQRVVQGLDLQVGVAGLELVGQRGELAVQAAQALHGPQLGAQHHRATPA
jgi:hypothetical protein